MSDSEYAVLEKKADALDVSCQEYIRILIRKQKIIQPILSKENIKEAIYALNFFGNKINQQPSTEELEHIREQLDKLCVMLSKATKQVSR